MKRLLTTLCLALFAFSLVATAQSTTNFSLEPTGQGMTVHTLEITCDGNGTLFIQGPVLAHAHVDDLQMERTSQDRTPATDNVSFGGAQSVSVVSNTGTSVFRASILKGEHTISVGIFDQDGPTAVTVTFTPTVSTGSCFSATGP